MLRLTHSDLRAALRFLAACDAGSGLHAYARSVVGALPALIPCDVAVFGLANPRAQTLDAVENPRLTTTADLETFMRVSSESPNPPLDHFVRTGDPEARLISDFVTRRQYHALPLYTDFYRPLRVEFILGACINRSPTAFDGITLGRTRPDFRERDRAVLTLLRPHILQGYRTAMAIDRLRADVVLATHARETAGFGLVVLSGNFRIHFVSPGAVILLEGYFGARRQVDELPDSLAHWVRQQADAVRDASRLPDPQPPFVVDRNGGRVIVRAVSTVRDTWLFLEETKARAAQASVRLTPHERRLLLLLTQGHSYKTAAAVVGSSVHTVAFHMKHIYAKLQVHSKSEAVAKALRDGIVE